jgi:hypothetical protein
MIEAGDTDIPAGFEPLFRTSPFLDTLGSVLLSPDPARLCDRASRSE